MKAMPKVVVAMSGGVDSSVAAALLFEQGYEVIGMMMRLWTESGRESYNRCCTPTAMARARQVAAQLEFPFYAIDAQQVFHDVVVNYFIDGYLSGNTPNPCLMCNRHIRWEFLLDQALAMDADYMATGHYARTVQGSTGIIQLLRAADNHKDQSYILSVLNQEKLKYAIFPLGDMKKKEVREYAMLHNLPSSSTKDSQDLCFLADTDYQSFLDRNTSENIVPGMILNSEGDVLGEHNGLPYYTLGQRKGLGISSSMPLYVISKNLDENTITVGKKSDLEQMQLDAEEMNWIAGSPPGSKFRGDVKIRYTSQQIGAEISVLDENRISIEFDMAIAAITPGQAAVIYIGEEVIGSGIICTNDRDKTIKDSHLLSLEITQ